jgi:chromosome segregation protein
MRARINELRDPVLLAELRAYEDKRTRYTEELIVIDGDLRRIEGEVTTIRIPERDKALSIQKQLETDEGNFTKESHELKESMKKQQGILKETEEKAQKFQAQFKDLFEKRNRLEEEIRKNDGIIEKKSDSSRSLEIRLNTLSIKNAEINANLSSLNSQFEQYHGVEILPFMSEEDLKREISKFRKMQEGIGSVNMRALDIYDEIEKQYANLLEKKDTLVKEKDDVLLMMHEIEGKKKELFMKTYDAIESNFKRIFALLTKKGDAELLLENTENPFEGGLEIKVRLVGNKFMDIRSLSGGEKTLTALAFIFAIQEYEPASFYVLDEVDAALDKHNSEKFAKLIGKYAQNAQYIIISHNDSVIAQANNLYGVSMDENGVTKVISLKI